MPAIMWAEIRPEKLSASDAATRSAALSLCVLVAWFWLLFASAKLLLLSLPPTFSLCVSDLKMVCLITIDL